MSTRKNAAMAGPRFRGWVRVSRSGWNPTRSSVYTLRRVSAGSERLIHVVRLRGALLQIIDRLAVGSVESCLIDDRLRVWMKVSAVAGPSPNRAHTDGPTRMPHVKSLRTGNRRLRSSVAAAIAVLALAAAGIGTDSSLLVNQIPPETASKPTPLVASSWLTPSPERTGASCRDSPTSDSAGRVGVPFGGVAVSVDVVQNKVEQTLVLASGCWMPLGE